MSDNKVNDMAAQMENTIRTWAAITIKQFRDNIRKEGMRTNNLYKSFQVYIEKGADGMPSQVSIGFLYHGRFVDMGVGKGFPIGAKGTDNFKKHRNKSGQLNNPVVRKPKKWYSKTSYRELKVLSEIITKKYMIVIPKVVELDLKAALIIDYK